MIPLIICLLILLVVVKLWLSSSKRTGKIGERKVARQLHRLSKKYIVLNNLLLDTSCGTTQIDHIVISPYGIFVIETKNYKGWIFGHENSQEWKQSLLGKRTFFGWSSNQYKFRNPIRQNMAHVIAVKAILKEIGDFKIVPIVTFSDNAELNITTPNNIVINWNDLYTEIKSYNTQCIGQEDIHRIVHKLQNANISNEESISKHIYDIQENLQNRNLAISNRICPKCGGRLVERKGKFGEFWGCSNYPSCKFTNKSS